MRYRSKLQSDTQSEYLRLYVAYKKVGYHGLSTKDQMLFRRFYELQNGKPFEVPASTQITEVKGSKQYRIKMIKETR